jgi:hypothetical protein
MKLSLLTLILTLSLFAPPTARARVVNVDIQNDSRRCVGGSMAGVWGVGFGVCSLGFNIFRSNFNSPSHPHPSAYIIETFCAAPNALIKLKLTDITIADGSHPQHPLFACSLSF